MYFIVVCRKGGVVPVEGRGLDEGCWAGLIQVEVRQPSTRGSKFGGTFDGGLTCSKPIDRYSVPHVTCTSNPGGLGDYEFYSLMSEGQTGAPC